MLINKYHKIYIDIFSDSDKTHEDKNQIMEEVERFIAYSMTGETKYLTNFQFNLGRTAANGKSTISKMYQRVLRIYWAKISIDTFSSKNKANQKDVYNYQTSRYIYCDDIDIYHLDNG